ncbi:PucR family transcriptional regulator [Brevibacterium spongiae]|uniref:PucR family transcriptional regulator n=1 Tax=Brevibacterium spongiae TaxID=2909672 RepID=A0ABY5SM90_9MICO|nr:PucR family transcriptional regulator [Brevibacterium spongiae]UVI35066.1 PucR family transcriptional regulator [Brevibacterium spongiae]
MVTLEQLWSRSELALEIIVDSPTAAEQDVTIVHSSELPEVDEWLAGGEVLLTIGVGQDLGADTVADYVRRLKDVGVHALGIGLGSDLPWQEVPERLIAGAEAVGLAVFGVPEPVPFVAVVDAFTRMREAETNRELTRASSAARRFANALAHHGPGALVADLAETLGAEVRFVSPTGRALSGENAEDDVRAALIEEYLTPTLSPRLIRTGARIIEAVPSGSDRPLGWILTPAEAAGSPKTRALLLSTAAALLAMTLTELPAPAGPSRLFESELSTEEARAEWTRATGLAPVATTGVRFFAGVRGDTAEHLIADIVGAALVTRAGSLLGIAGGADLGLEDLVTRAATVACLEPVAEKRIPVSQIHHMWTLLRTQHETEASEVKALLSAVDEETADRFVDRVLGELIRARGGQELLETLRAFIQAGGAKERIAAELGIHRHTVRARMAKIEKLLGRDLSRAETLQAVSMALELAEL